MIKIKEYVRIILFVLIVIFVISTAASAQSPQPLYIYIERTTISPTLPGDVIMINYGDALGTPLYEATKSAMIEAITNSRGLWIEVEINNSMVIIDYKKVLEDRLTYTEAVALGAGSGNPYLTTRPNTVAEMYFDTVTSTIKYKSPSVLAPIEFPAWLAEWETDVYHKYVWEEFTKSWVVTIKINAAELPGIGTLSNIKVRIKGVIANPVPGTGNVNWFAVIPEPEPTPPDDYPVTIDLSPGDVEVLVGLQWYNQ